MLGDLCVTTSPGLKSASASCYITSSQISGFAAHPPAWKHPLGAKLLLGPSKAVWSPGLQSPESAPASHWVSSRREVELAPGPCPVDSSHSTGSEDVETWCRWSQTGLLTGLPWNCFPRCCELLQLQLHPKTLLTSVFPRPETWALACWGIQWGGSHDPHPAGLC